MENITITQQEAERLADILINTQRFNRPENEAVSKKVGVYDLLKKSEEIKHNAPYADNYETEKREISEAEKLSDEAKVKISSVMKDNGYVVPDLTQSGKENQIREQLQEIGFSEKDVDVLIENGLGKAETTGETISLTMKNTEQVKSVLQEKGFDFEEQGDNLKLKGKLYIQEGVEVEATPQNLDLLKKNDISYFDLADKERKVFVPLQAKKVATLIALTAIAGPAGIAVQILLNQTGLLNKLVDQHQLSVEQQLALQKGLTVAAMQRVDGKDVKQFLYRDQETGGLHRINMSDVQIPKSFMGVQLTPAQLSSLKEGKNVDVMRDGVYYQFRLDLQEESGLKAAYKQVSFDNYKEVPKPNSPDADKLEYISVAGKQGVDDIYHGNGMRMERDSFLEGHNLKDRFVELEKLSKSLNSGSIDPYSAAFKVATNELKEKSSQFAELAEDVIFFDANKGRGR